jgi:NTP pyrophosphatase (non-canonical NTP hydrolase)
MNGPYSIGADKWNGLSKLIEECGEVIQVAGKIIGASGAEEHWDGSNLPQRLLEELGDLQAAIFFITAHYDHTLACAKVRVRAIEKFTKFEEWNEDK